MTGTLTALPAILYNRASDMPIAITLSNCSSVNPCSLKHSLGVNLLIYPTKKLPCSLTIIIAVTVSLFGFSKVQ